jgi:hypothetical protein
MRTVRDAISDLPRKADEKYYSSVPQSDYARMLRGNHATLWNHVTKTQSPLNQLRFEHVPAEVPGADWRDLPDQLIPFFGSTFLFCFFILLFF